MSRQDLNALINELAVATDPVRREELIAALRAAGVTVNATPKVIEPDGQVPKGCVRGEDGIIRSTPGTFEQTYRLEVERRAQSERSYRREAQALRRLARQKVSRGPQIHVPARTLEGRAPRPRRRSSRARARAPARPRPSDVADPPRSS